MTGYEPSTDPAYDYDVFDRDGNTIGHVIVRDGVVTWVITGTAPSVFEAVAAIERGTR